MKLNVTLSDSSSKATDAIPRELSKSYRNDAQVSLKKLQKTIENFFKTFATCRDSY
jgi:hypothetical protein